MKIRYKLKVLMRIKLAAFVEMAFSNKNQAFYKCFGEISPMQIS
jgi:hypothetical protein